MVRILLVDDNAMIRSQLRTALEKQDDWVVVGEAEDGRAALQQWSESHPHLTVMDFVMPQMDGLEAGRRLSKQHPDAPVLMVTIDPSRQLEQEAKKAGIRGLCKKSDLHSLFEAIEALIKGKTYFHMSPAAA
ncbi:MAG: response regulator transcription factor [Candidatus Sulfotelmatobacter sp.]